VLSASTSHALRLGFGIIFLGGREGAVEWKMEGEGYERQVTLIQRMDYGIEWSTEWVGGC
jgi:hypothetical protein